MEKSNLHKQMSSLQALDGTRGRVVRDAHGEIQKILQ